MATSAVGLRQRKKLQTRQVIVASAKQLFAEQGFDQVTVRDVARVAGVSEVTVFNYFPTKAALYFGGMQLFEERLVDAVRTRAAGVSALAAFSRLVLEGCSCLTDDTRLRAIERSAWVIGGSSALQAHEREIVAHHTKQLARLLAAESGVRSRDVEPWAAANALMGVHRALVSYVRASVVAGRWGPRLAANARTQAKRAFACLEGGMAHYATKQRA